MQTGFFFGEADEPSTDFLQLDNIIVDRGSKYSVTIAEVTNTEDIKNILKRIKSNKKFAKATHNSFAVRYKDDNKVIETKSDDGETGAGMVILRSIRKVNMINVIVVVTRWFGGVKLYNDRFKHIQDASLLILNKIKI